MAILINNYNHHTITEDGVVTNTKTGNVKSHWLIKAGYLCVDIQEEGIAKKHYVHRLLAEHFIPNPDNKKTVNHKDGVKSNNNLSNLEWATYSENSKHAYDNNLKYCTTKKISNEALEDILVKFLEGQNLTTLVESYPFKLPTLSTYLSKYAESTNRLELFEKEKARQKVLRNKNANHVTYKVQMIDKSSLEILKIFNSLSEACNFLGKTTSGPISNVLNGRQLSAYGYFWKRV